MVSEALAEARSGQCNCSLLTIGPAFRDIKQDNLYPSVGFKKPGEHVRVNFGQEPFVFDIDGYVKVRKRE